MAGATRRRVTCWLAGAYRLDDEQHATRAIRLSLSTDGGAFAKLLAARAIPVKGELEAEQLANARPIAGTVTRVGPHMRYGLAFDDDDGRACELTAEQELRLRRPPHGFSVVRCELRREGNVIGEGRLRLDPRDLVKELLPWA